jgi:hypothetical protein
MKNAIGAILSVAIIIGLIVLAAHLTGDNSCERADRADRPCNY